MAERTTSKVVGMYVGCGAYRPKWLNAKSKRRTLTFSFSVEVPAGEEFETVEVLRESVHDAVSSWSRSCLCKLKKRVKEKKGG